MLRGGAAQAACATVGVYADRGTAVGVAKRLVAAACGLPFATVARSRHLRVVADSQHEWHALWSPPDLPPARFCASPVAALAAQTLAPIAANEEKKKGKRVAAKHGGAKPRAMPAGAPLVVKEEKKKGKRVVAKPGGVKTKAVSPVAPLAVKEEKKKAKPGGAKTKAMSPAAPVAVKEKKKKAKRVVTKPISAKAMPAASPLVVKEEKKKGKRVVTKQTARKSRSVPAPARAIAMRAQPPNDAVAAASSSAKLAARYTPTSPFALPPMFAKEEQVWQRGNGNTGSIGIAPRVKQTARRTPAAAHKPAASTKLVTKGAVWVVTKEAGYSPDGFHSAMPPTHTTVGVFDSFAAAVSAGREQVGKDVGWSWGEVQDSGDLEVLQDGAEEWEVCWAPPDSEYCRVKVAPTSVVQSGSTAAGSGKRAKSEGTEARREVKRTARKSTGGFRPRFDGLNLAGEEVDCVGDEEFSCMF